MDDTILSVTPMLESIIVSHSMDTSQTDQPSLPISPKMQRPDSSEPQHQGGVSDADGRLSGEAQEDHGYREQKISTKSSTVRIDSDGLSWPQPGTRARRDATPDEAQARLERLQQAVKTILECIGEDPDREGLLGTPERYAKAMLFSTKGYEENVQLLVNDAVFHEDHGGLVIVKDIDVYSLCEHHLIPFKGKIHIGYIPKGRVIGLSKLARIAKMFSRRLQVQERLTRQVATMVEEILTPLGCGVVMEASHLCIEMRGVENIGASTTTTCMLGSMLTCQRTGDEFLKLLERR